MTSKRLLDYISPIYEHAVIGLQLLNAIGVELEDLAQWSDGMWQQIHPQTATWSLPYWELSYGRTPDERLPLKQRQAQLLGTIQSRAPMNPAKLAQLGMAITGADTRIEECVSKSTFYLWLYAQYAQAADETALKAAIDKAKPAHLRCVIKYEQQLSTLFSVAGIVQVYQNFTIRQVN